MQKSRVKIEGPSPLTLLYGKQRLSPKEREDVEIPIYHLACCIWQDSVGEDDFDLGSGLLVMLQMVAKGSDNRALYDKSLVALDAWFTAGVLRDEMRRKAVTFSTTQRRSILEALRQWPVVLGQITRAQLISAALRWCDYRKEWAIESPMHGYLRRLTN